MSESAVVTFINKKADFCGSTDGRQSPLVLLSQRLEDGHEFLRKILHEANENQVADLPFVRLLEAALQDGSTASVQVTLCIEYCHRPHWTRTHAPL